jgi:hypothetical protein
MPMKGAGAADPTVLGEFDGGFTWTAYPDEAMERASHGLRDGGDLWLVDPVDAAGLDDLLAERGSVAGIVVLLERHTRDAGALARRHDVAVHRPPWMRTVDDDVDAPTRALGSVAGYDVHRRLDTPVWKEAALYHPDDRTLVVPESLGTAGFFLGGDERLGVHPMLRLFPPRDLLEFAPERVLVGHGTPVAGRAASALREAVRGSRRRAPSVYANALRSLVP